MNIIIFIFCYFFIGWAWATLVIYKDWKVDNDRHCFGFSLWMWPIDMLGRVIFILMHATALYHKWLVEQRKKHDENP